MIRTFAIALALIPNFAFAGEGSKVFLTSDPFNEVMREAAKISGARLVGLISSGPKSDKLSVAANIPADWKNEQVCLKVVSADGLYESYNSYTVAPDWEGGEVVLPYPSKVSGDVLSIPANLISGVLLKGSCDSDATEVAPVFWGEGPHGELKILLNTSRADETYLTFSDYPDQQEIVCQPVDTASRTAFDVMCSLPEALASKDSLKAVFLSFRNGEMGREEHIILRPGRKL